MKNRLLERTIILMAAIAISNTLCSCSKRNNSEASANSDKSEKVPLIGFSIDTLAIERWQRDLDIFISTARSMGAEVLVQNAGNSCEEQNRQIQYLASRNVDVAVILPRDAKSLTESIEKLKSKNIPVISYDRLILNAPIDLYMTINSESVGRIMGKQMMQNRTAQKWSCILGSQEDNNMEMIYRGINLSIHNSGIEITDLFYTNGWNYDLSQKHMIELITSGKIPDAIICGNDAIADSVISVLKTYCPNKHIPICGQDADIAACQNIVRGYQDFTVYKPIGQLASLAAEYATKVAMGKTIPEVIEYSQTINNGHAEIPCVLLEPVYVDKNNMKEIIIDSNFHTEGEIYKDN